MSPPTTPPAIAPEDIDDLVPGAGEAGVVELAFLLPLSCVGLELDDEVVSLGDGVEEPPDSAGE